jgi:hypothetical protein
MTLRNPISLNAALRYRGRDVERNLRIEADPAMPDELRQHLLAAMMRVHRRGPIHIESYALDLWRPGVDLDLSHPWMTFTDVRKR